MTSSVTLTSALRANLLSLQGTAKLLDQTQIRLSTGRKVNSALDNPSAFFAAKSLTNRAGDLSNLLDSMGQATQVLKAADQGISSLTTLVEQAKAIAQSAQNQVSNSGLLRTGDISVALQANVGALAPLVLTSGSGATASITTSGQSLATIAAAINSSTGFSAQIVDGATGTAAGVKRLEIRATGGHTLSLAAGTATDFFILNNGGTGGAVAQTGAGAAYVAAATIASTANPLDMVALENQYRTVRSQIDALVTDTGYQGTNLLNGDTLNVQFNETNSSKLAITGVTFNTTGLGLSFSATGATESFLTSANITTAISQINSSLNTLRAAASTFGNNLNIVQARQDFTTNLVNNLKAGSDLLTLADTNEEGANLLALQTSQQLGIQALSLASQANQSVLRLFS